MRTQAGYAAPFAPYPSVGYPLIDFAGAGNLSPRRAGVGASAANMAGNTVGSGNPVGGLLPSSIAKSKPLAVIVVVGVGYLIWHIASKV